MGKRNYKYLWSLFPGLVVIAGNLAGGWWVISNFVFSIGILAFLELFIASDTTNETDEPGWFPDGLLLIHVVSQLTCLGTMFWALANHELSLLQQIAMGISTGVNSGGAAIVISHELVHRKSTFMRRCGQLLLFSAGNIYFYIDHLKVHHKWVGTAKDPATSRFGETLYAFFIRSTVQQIVSSYKLEQERLQKEKGFSVRSINYVVGSILLQLVLWVVLYYYLGVMGVVIYLVQAFMANFLLEYTNYIEHYGLARTDKERVTELHSWQTDKLISRFFLIDLSRHADHHYYASKPYQELKSYETSPILPGGYVSMIYYALIPPLFFSKMNPLVLKYRKPSA